MSSAEERTRKVIESFCRTLPGEVGKLSTLLEESQSSVEGRFEKLDALRFEAHRMVGSATCMGFPFVGDTFASIEMQLTRAIETQTNLTRPMAVNIALQLQSIARLISQVRPENSRLLRDIKSSMTEEPVLKSSEKIQEEFFAAQRIAFADDDMAIRQLMQNILSSLGLKTFGIYDDGESLIQGLSSLRPTLIISDWMMQPGTGMDVLKTVRSGKTDIDPETSVMFLTSVKTLEKVSEAIEAGVDDFLVKPFTVNMVKKCITRSAQLRAARLKQTAHQDKIVKKEPVEELMAMSSAEDVDDDWYL